MGKVQTLTSEAVGSSLSRVLLGGVLVAPCPGGAKYPYLSQSLMYLLSDFAELLVGIDS